jgi:hypothetical protein
LHQRTQCDLLARHAHLSKHLKHGAAENNGLRDSIAV